MTVEWTPVQPPFFDVAAPSIAPSPAPRSEFRALFEVLGRELDRGQVLVERTTRGGAARFDPAELIALQAGIYRYTEAVELAAKFVDRAQNAVRTTLESGGR